MPVEIPHSAFYIDGARLFSTIKENQSGTFGNLRAEMPEKEDFSRTGYVGSSPFHAHLYSDLFPIVP